MTQVLIAANKPDQLDSFASVKVELVSAGSGVVWNDDTLVYGVATHMLNEEGELVLELLPNNQGNPPNTYYRIMVGSLEEGGIERLIQVPSSNTLIFWGDPAIQVISPELPVLPNSPSGLYRAQAILAGEEVVNGNDPISLRNWSGEVEIVSLPVSALTPGKVIVVSGPHSGLWDWDGSSFTQSSSQPTTEPVYVEFAGADGTGTWLARSVIDPTGPFAPFSVRVDRTQVWTEPQTTLRTVNTDGSVSTFAEMEITDPNNPSSSIEMGAVIAAGSNIPQLGVIIAGGVEFQEWSPFANNITGARGYFTYSFTGVDGNFAPVFRFAFRRANTGSNAFESGLTPVMVGTPTIDDDAATKLYVDQSIANVDTPAFPARMRFGGTWITGTYDPQDVVTHKSASWVAMNETTHEPGSDFDTDWIKLSDMAGPILPTEGMQSFVWPGSPDGTVNLTAETILTGGAPAGDGDIEYTGEFTTPSSLHSLYVPSPRTSGALGIRFPNPGIGRWVDTFFSMYTASELGISIYQVLADNAPNFLVVMPGSSEALWRVLVIGTDTANPNVTFTRLTLRTV